MSAQPAPEHPDQQEPATALPAAAVPVQVNVDAGEVYSNFAAQFPTALYGKSVVCIALSEDSQTVGALVPTRRLVASTDQCTDPSEYAQLEISLEGGSLAPGIATFVDEDSGRSGFAALWKNKEQTGIFMLLQQPSHQFVGFSLDKRSDGSWGWSVSSAERMFQDGKVTAEVKEVLLADEVVAKILNEGFL